METPLKKDLEALENPGINSFEHISVSSKPYEWGLGSTPRVARLREGLYSKANVLKEWSDVLSGVAKPTFRSNVRLDVDRAKLVTDSYRQTRGKPLAIRRALCMKKLFEELPLFIEDGQLLVGDPNSAPDEIRWFPEVACDYMIDAVKPDGGFGHMVNDEERKLILDYIIPYWKDECQDKKIRETIPEDIFPYVFRSPDNPSAFSSHWNAGRTEITFDYDVLFEQGLNRRIKMVEEKLEKLEAEAKEGMTGLSVKDYITKKQNWEAQIISGKAMVRFAERYAELAEQQAAEQKDEKRKEELLELARICRKVPANPPESFYEALQFFWCIETGRIINVPTNGLGVRIDQVWYPYYRKDIENGVITRDQAKELLECWMMRVQAVGSHAEEPQLFTLTSGGEIFYTANIGGTHMDGTDACNDLTALLLENLATLRINQPPIMFRMHRNVSENMLTRVTETIRAGTGHPSVFNEDLMEKWALLRGYSPYDAKRTQAAGCVTMSCTGKPLSAGFMIEVGFIAQGKMLEYALFQGDDTFGMGNRAGSSKITRPETKDPREMKSADELLEAHCEQLNFYMRIANISHNIAHEIILENCPEPLFSFLLDGTMEEGKDLHQAWTEFDTWPNLISLGFVNVSDSLADIQRLVFNEKKYTMDQLLNALKTNW
ncbi:MAG: hypothetical protein J7L16_06375 [Deltaproteobacteria bacterium]|nr:hypothetical protein [Deltaproteobacteria bacterium]